MMDLNKEVPWLGTAGTRGMKGIEALNRHNAESGCFTHNGITITVQRDSTARELDWQYEEKRLRMNAL